MAPTTNRYMQAQQVAEDAIRLFIEFRDVHGYSESRAQHAAICEVIEGMAAEGPERGE